MKFACPHCQTPLEADDSFAGAAVDCPMCGKQLAIPSVPSAEPPPPAAQPEQTPPPPPATEPAPGTGEEQASPAPEPVPEAPAPQEAAADAPPPPPPPAPKAAPKFRVVSKSKRSAPVSGASKMASAPPVMEPRKKVECPHCLAACEVPGSAMGMCVDCPSCGKRFQAQAASSGAAVAGGRLAGIKKSMAVMGGIFRNVADRLTEGNKMPLKIPLVSQSLVLALVVLFTLLFCLNANAQFTLPPVHDEVYYPISDQDMREIRRHWDNINDAQRTYDILNGGNPANWLHMLRAKYQERHSTEMLDKEIRRTAERVASGTPLEYSYYAARSRLQPGTTFIAMDADAGYTTTRDAVIAYFKESMNYDEPGDRNPARGGGVSLLWLFPIFALLNIMLTTIFHYKCWAVLPAKYARLTPAKAAGKLLIPFYCLYWVFPSIAGLGAGCVAFAKDRELHGFGHLRRLGVALAILTCAGGGLWVLACFLVVMDGMASSDIFLSLWATGGFPVIGLLLAIAKFVTWRGFYTGVTQLLNHVPAAERAVAFAG